MKQIGDLPLRADNHIKETVGYKVLENLIPGEWIIRNVTERDYGIDCYIELVSQDKRLTGEIAFVQMKTTAAIEWRKSDVGYKFYEVDRKTTNYLRNFKIPTYLFLVDLSTREMFFLSVKEFVQEHYKEYLENSTFAYEFFYNRDAFSKDSFLENFRRNNQYEQFRNELQYFMSNIERYISFMMEHNNRDFFMQIEKEEMLFFESLERNICFLQKYFNTKNNLTPIEELVKKGNAMFGDNYEQTLFEQVLTDLFDEFKQSILEIITIITDLVTKKEYDYWFRERNYIYNYFNNLDKSKLFA